VKYVNQKLSWDREFKAVIQPDKMTVSAREVDVQKNWWVVDATGQTLGRLASQVAHILRGKHKPLFTPHIDCGDFVVVVNADKIEVAPKRAEQKVYIHHTGYPGGQRIKSYRQMMDTTPERIIEIAVKRMLPKNSLGRRMGMKLKVYAGGEHPHSAQKPQTLELKYK
jgi:large subunit ribosomal protein L13